ncbi:MAG: pilin [Patescibacteria group bacterium]
MFNQKKIVTFFLTIFLLSSIFIFVPIYTNAVESIFGTLPECFKSPPTKECTICDIIGMIVGLAKWILGFIGVLALLLFVWAGFGLIISAGNEEAIKKNKGILVGTLVGIIIVLVAWEMVWLVVSTLTTDTISTTKNGLTILGQDWSDWTKACGTPPPPSPPVTPKKQRGQPCINNDDCIIQTPALRCAIKYGQTTSICAFNKTVLLGEKCYPLKDPDFECKIGKCTGGDPGTCSQ